MATPSVYRCRHELKSVRSCHDKSVDQGTKMETEIRSGYMYSIGDPDFDVLLGDQPTWYLR
jgi:hypothetical protein